MERFPAQVRIQLADGRTLTEGYNQAEMARFQCQRMLARLSKGLPLVHYDGERIEIPATAVVAVEVAERDLAFA